MTTEDQKFKEFLRAEARENPELVRIAAKLALLSRDKHFNVLDDKTINAVSNLHNITKDQAKELWEKLMKFNELLMKKYGDAYLENADEVCSITQKYKNNLVKQYHK
jgi:predicted translin family RNA/ssDNA-binding protein